MGMKAYLKRRLIITFLCIIFTINLTFFLFRILPPDLDVMLFSHNDHQWGRIGPEGAERVRNHLGVDKPLLEQYLIFIDNLLSLDLGWSFNFVTRTGDRDVSKVIFGDRLINTMTLLGSSLVLAFLIIVISDKIPNYDDKPLLIRILKIIPQVVYSAPVFWVAIMVLLFLSPPLPIGGTIEPGTPTPSEDYFAYLQVFFEHMVGPLITLTLFIVGWFFTTGQYLLNNLIEDYSRIEGAKILRKQRIWLLRPRKMIIVSIFTLGMPYFIIAVVLTETVFAWSGLGLLWVQAINYRDYPVLLGMFYFSLMTVFLAYLLGHILFALENHQIETKERRTSLPEKQENLIDSSRDIFRETPVILIGASIIMFFIALAFYVPAIALYDPNESFVGAPNSKPSSVYLLGTDANGSDIFSQVLWSIQTIFLISVSATFIAVIIGSIIGLIWGHFHHRLDTIITGFTDFFMQTPGLLLILIIFILYEPSAVNLIILMSILSWSGIARVVRAETINYKQELSVDISRVIFRYTASIISILVGVLLLEVSISFLGFADPRLWTCGRILNNAQTKAALIFGYDWWLIAPGLCTLFLVLGFSLLRSGFMKLETKIRRVEIDFLPYNEFRAEIDSLIGQINVTLRETTLN